MLAQAAAPPAYTAEVLIMIIDEVDPSQPTILTADA